MIAPERRPPRIQFTIGLLLKLVLICGLLCANVSFLLHADPRARSTLTALEIAWLPLALALLVRFLARPGPWRSWVLHFLVLPYVAGPALLGVLAVGAGLYEFVRERRMTAVHPEFVVVAFGFGWFTVYMVRQLIPGRCPRCRRRALLPDMGVRTLDPSIPMQFRGCVACGLALARRGNGPWEPIDTPTR